LKGTREAVGSEEEYRFACVDCKETSLELDAVFKRRGARRRSVIFTEPTGIEGDVVNHGSWSSCEKQLFGLGVRQIGWSEWEKIARLVQTRTNKQVEGFSRTIEGKMYARLSCDTQEDSDEMVC
jgi:hypothetical protein